MPQVRTRRHDPENFAVNRHCLQMPKRRKPHEVRRGHSAHISGSGVHLDRRTRRRRARQAAGGRAVRDSLEDG